MLDRKILRIKDAQKLIQESGSILEYEDYEEEIPKEGDIALNLNHRKPKKYVFFYHYTYKNEKDKIYVAYVDKDGEIQLKISTYKLAKALIAFYERHVNKKIVKYEDYVDIEERRG